MNVLVRIYYILIKHPIASHEGSCSWFLLHFTYLLKQHGYVLCYSPYRESITDSPKHIVYTLIQASRINS